MAHFSFTQHDNHNYEGTTQSSVTRDFETETLMDIAEQFYWFIRACGYDYVKTVSIGDNVEFSI